MFDAPIRRRIDPALDRLGVTLARLGLSANALTVSGFLLGVAAWAALAWQLYGWALGFLVANRAFDGLDGAVARRRGPTDLGGFLDIVFDFVFYAGFPFFFAVGQPNVALAAAFLIFSFMGTGASFLAYATLAAKRNISTQARGRKSLYYLGGLTEGTETFAVFAAVCVWPGFFAPIAWAFGGLCWLTTATRIMAGIDTFREADR